MQNLNRVQNDVNTLKTIKIEKASTETSKPKSIAKDDPIYTRIEIFQKVLADQENSIKQIKQLEEAMTNKIQTIDKQIGTHEDKVKRLESSMTSTAKEKPKDQKYKEIESKASLVDGFAAKLKQNEQRITMLQDQLKQFQENAEDDLIEKLKPIHKQMKKILSL